MGEWAEHGDHRSEQPQGQDQGKRVLGTLKLPGPAVSARTTRRDVTNTNAQRAVQFRGLRPVSTPRPATEKPLVTAL